MSEREPDLSSISVYHGRPHAGQGRCDVCLLLRWLDELMPSGQPYDECCASLLALDAECDLLRAGAARVAYAWENLRGWLPDGRGVENWTRELGSAIAALDRKEPE